MSSKPDLPDLPIPEEKPHRTVKSVFDTLLSIPKSIGGAFNKALDKLPLGNKGPHSTVDSVAQGVMGATQSIGDGVAEGLDKPLDAAQDITKM